MPRDRLSQLTVSQLNELLDLADFPAVGTAIRVRIRKLVREVFDLHTRLRCQEDKWPIFREKLVEIFPPLRNFPHRIEVLYAYARRSATDQISRQIAKRTSPKRKRQLSQPSRLTYADTGDVDIKQESGTQVQVHDCSLIIRPTSSAIHLIRSSYCEEIPTQGRISTPTCRCYP
ncbi:hypothetical protein M378DRAFT_156857 [Amanita muscaria Koide BX008]|uniref:Uncharacterized protein n=1 Tax=Amanita muscaria (strain Koide BX008) TaxID=946122 RepID=A0A0C2X5N2_AMAMK|nr:hypothetical protein M378DRAFT_156857 [Amanita muscaria Koide BX008]